MYSYNSDTQVGYFSHLGDHSQIEYTDGDTSGAFDAAEQLFQDEYGATPNDGLHSNMFEIVGVPDDVANADPSYSEVVVSLDHKNPDNDKLVGALLQAGAVIVYRRD